MIAATYLFQKAYSIVIVFINNINMIYISSVHKNEQSYVLWKGQEGWNKLFHMMTVRMRWDTDSDMDMNGSSKGESSKSEAEVISAVLLKLVCNMCVNVCMYLCARFRLRFRLNINVTQSNFAAKIKMNLIYPRKKCECKQQQVRSAQMNSTHSVNKFEEYTVQK